MLRDGAQAPERRVARLRQLHQVDAPVGGVAAAMAAPAIRRTAVPVQVIAPRRDSFVSVSLARSAEPFADDFTMRENEGGHWVVRHRPELVAGPVRAFVRALPPRRRSSAALRCCARW